MLRRPLLGPLTFLSILVIVSAVLSFQVDPGLDFLRSNGARPGPAQHTEQNRQALSADLNGILEATRARLEELGEVAAKAAAVQRARQAARNEADVVRGELERARQELIAAKAEMQRLMIANAELEKQVTSLRIASSSATEGGREMEELAKLNADVFAFASSEGASLPRSPEVIPDPVESEEPTDAALPSAMAPPPAPEQIAETGAGEPAASAPELPSADRNEATSEETGAVLASFRADLKVLNDIERKSAGIEPFSDIELVSGRAVHIKVTSGWDALSPVAKQSYLDVLLDLWVATQGREGPAVVRIVDASGRKLIEKSSP